MFLLRSLVLYPAACTYLPTFLSFYKKIVEMARRGGLNKLTKARKTRKSPGTLGLKKFGPGILWVGKVWTTNMFINFFAKLDNLRKIIFLFFYF